MGGVLNKVLLSPKAKTVEAAKKEFHHLAEYDRYENGHSYSGGIGMIDRVIPTNLIFNNMDEFEEWLLPKMKGEGYLVRIREIRQTKPLAKALFDLNSAKNNLGTAKRMGRIYEHPGAQAQFKEVKWTPALERRLQAKVDKAQAKYQRLLDAQAAKSTKTRFAVGGWCSN